MRHDPGTEHKVAMMHDHGTEHNAINDTMTLKQNTWTAMMHDPITEPNDINHAYGQQ